jgi:hypothetical protein
MTEEETAKEMVSEFIQLDAIYARDCAGVTCNYVIGSCPPDKVPYWTKVRELVKTIQL